MLSKCELKIGNIENAKKWLYEGLNIIPNAELVCELANIYAKTGEYDKAIYFYESALNISKPTMQGFFIREEYYYFVPLLELVVLYYKIGDYDKAKSCHNQCKKLYPNNKKVIFNEHIFKM